VYSPGRFVMEGMDGLKRGGVDFELGGEVLGVAGECQVGLLISMS
jgi:hypothetical protein